MSHDRCLHLSPRARPVAGEPVDGLLARADELTKRWVIALILSRPLERLAEIPFKDLAREGPALCAHAARALGSDAELERIAGAKAASAGDEEAPAHRVGALAGAPDARAVVDAVEALRGVLWEALLEELRWPTAALGGGGHDRLPAQQVADLADRLAYVCAKVLAGALTGVGVQAPTVSAGPTAVASPGSRQAAVPVDRMPTDARRAVLVDERDGLTFSPSAEAAPPAPVLPETPQPSPERPSGVHPLPWDTPAPIEMRAKRAGEPTASIDDPA